MKKKASGYTTIATNNLRGTTQSGPNAATFGHLLQYPRETQLYLSVIFIFDF